MVWEWISLKRESDTDGTSSGARSVAQRTTLGSCHTVQSMWCFEFQHVLVYHAAGPSLSPNQYPSSQKCHRPLAPCPGRRPATRLTILLTSINRDVAVYPTSFVLHIRP